MASHRSSLKSFSPSDDLRPIEDKRKQKRLLSERESARRSRMRKQKDLDDLTAQISQLRNDNRQITTTLDDKTSLYMNVKEENSAIQIQISELSNRLRSLNEIIEFLDTCSYGIGSDNGMVSVNDSDYDDTMLMMMATSLCGF